MHNLKVFQHIQTHLFHFMTRWKRADGKMLIDFLSPPQRVATLGCKLPHLIPLTCRYSLRQLGTHATAIWPAPKASFKTTAPPVLCLERAIGERSGVDAALWSTGAFHAQVYPDLPLAATWAQLVQKALTQDTDTGGTTEHTITPGRAQQDSCLVRTVAAQCRSRKDIQERMRAACFPADAMSTPASALLLVSGSHPARQLPLASTWLQNSMAMLQDAKAMRAAGYLPPDVSLWAVENPLVNPPERALAKVAAGAEVLLTQPPFDREQGELWFGKLRDEGFGNHAKVFAGVPMASSAGNLEFWLRLCGVHDSPDGKAVLRSFPVQNGAGKAEYAAAVRVWNADFVQWVSALDALCFFRAMFLYDECSGKFYFHCILQVLGLPCVGGLHIMPLTKAGRDMTAAFLADGTIPLHASHVPGG